MQLNDFYQTLLFKKQIQSIIGMQFPDIVSDSMIIEQIKVLCNYKTNLSKFVNSLFHLLNSSDLNEIFTIIETLKNTSIKFNQLLLVSIIKEMRQRLTLPPNPSEEAIINQVFKILLEKREIHDFQSLSQRGNIIQSKILNKK